MLLQLHEPGQTPTPHETHPLAVGIDLGTTHSLVAIMEEGSPVILSEGGNRLLASTVTYNSQGEVVQIGQSDALSPFTIRSIKRLMGKTLEEVQHMNVSHLFPFKEGHSKEILLSVGPKTLSPIDISAEILTHLKKRAETVLEQTITQAVITVPAYFDEAARAATKAAAEKAGLQVLRLLNEPTAAALAYGLDKGREGIYLVYDLGGGTFDVSVMRMEKGVFQVLATGGNTLLGGDDIDHVFASFLWTRYGDSTPTAKHLNLWQAEAKKVKEQLSFHERASFLIPKSQESIPVTRAELEEAARPLVEKTLQLAEQALEDANLTTKALEGIILVGGSTRMPLIHYAIETRFGMKPLSDLNPDEIVALGAAIQAHALTQGANHLLLDVTPLSLGIETMGGVVEKIIYRNTPIPIAVSQEFTTYQDGQTGMKFHVVQGERELAEHCRSLAHFELSGIPPLKAGVARVKVTFTLDADGLLSVSAEETTTGIRQNILVKPSYGLEEGAVERMLLESMQHAASDIKQRLLVETRTEAKRHLQALNDALAQDSHLLTENELSQLTDRMQALETILSEEDRELILQKAKELEELTDILASKQMNHYMAAALRGKTVEEAEAIVNAPTINEE